MLCRLDVTRPRRGACFRPPDGRPDRRRGKRSPRLARLRRLAAVRASPGYARHSPGMLSPAETCGRSSASLGLGSGPANLRDIMPGLPLVISNGLIPACILFAGIILFYGQMKKKYSASKSEAIQAVVTLLLVSFFILTFTGIWFRGEGMALTWPL